jgi:DNA-binding CsgD family transcriptional regulator
VQPLTVKTLVMQSELPVTPQRVTLVEQGLADHPFRSLWPKLREPTALLFSDLARRHRDRHKGKYPELYRELEMGENMALPVGGRAGEFCGLGFINKRFGRFTERDRQMLNLLRPHLAAAYANAQRFSTVVASRTMGIEADLTAREADIAAWLALGKTNWEIGVICRVSVRTVEKHVERILTKLGVENRTAAVAALMERRLLQPSPGSDKR